MAVKQTAGRHSLRLAAGTIGMSITPPRAADRFWFASPGGATTRRQASLHESCTPGMW